MTLVRDPIQDNLIAQGKASGHTRANWRIYLSDLTPRLFR